MEHKWGSLQPGWWMGLTGDVEPLFWVDGLCVCGVRGCELATTKEDREKKRNKPDLLGDDDW